MNMRWEWYLSADDAWRAMLAACAEAKTSIACEQYIFKSDAVGESFISLFIKKAQQGVNVELLIDAVGGIFMSSASVAHLQNAGVRVRFFKPLRSWMPHSISSWFFRDHRKLLIVDGTIGFIGGVGVNARMHGWRDTHVRIEGPVVEQFTSSFRIMWRFAETRRFKRFPKNDFVDAFALITSAPHLRGRFIRKALVRAIRSAKQYIYLTTPYFIPDMLFLRAVRRAARRGVDVRILLPGISDHFWLDVASRTYFGSLFRAGVKIYEYGDGRKLLHAKTAAIDDLWGTVGSANWDNLSLRLNYEANLVSVEKQFVNALKAHFLNDLRQAREIQPNEWKRRSRLSKLFEAVTWPIHGIL